MSQEIDPNTLPIPKFPLAFGPVKVAPLEPDYVPKNK